MWLRAFTLISIFFFPAFAKDDIDIKQLLDRIQHLESTASSLLTTVSDSAVVIEEQSDILKSNSKKILELESRLEEQEHVNARLQTELGLYRTALSQKENQRTERFVLSDNDVGFFARVAETELTGLVINQSIVFESVEVNAGDGYDRTSGVFTAPREGLYLFAVSITSDFGSPHELQVAIKKNDVVIGKAHAHGDSGHLDQGSVTLVTALGLEDKVSVVLLDPDGATLYGNLLTTFAGHQIVFK